MRLTLPGICLELLDDADAFDGGLMPDAAEQQRYEGEDGDLRGERLGGGDADLGPGVHVHAAVALARDGAGDVVADAQGAVAFALALAHGRQGIGGLPALADDEDEGIPRHGHVPVAELAGELHLRGKMGERLDEVFAHQRGVVRGAAAAEDDALDAAQLLGRHLEPAEDRGRFLEREPAAHGVVDGLGLLVDFLQHVVRVSALADVFGRELDLADLVAGDAPEEGGDLELLAVDARDVEVVQVHGFPRVGDDRPGVAREKIFPPAHAQDERAAATRADNDARDLLVDEDDAVRADDLFQRRAQGRDEARLGRFTAGVVVVLADEMGEHLGIGLRLKGVALPEELVLQRLVVLDDAVVHERQLPALVEVRVRIRVGDAAVRGPPGVADADDALRRLLVDELGEIVDPAGAFPQLDGAVMEGGQACGIVAAVFHAAQPVQEDGDSLDLADVADNSTHTNFSM